MCVEVTPARRQHQPARAVGGRFGHLDRLDDFYAIVPLHREPPFLPVMAFFSSAAFHKIGVRVYCNFFALRFGL